MPTKEFFDAILFDMDGLLTNTEPLWEQTTTKVTSQLDRKSTRLNSSH